MPLSQPLITDSTAGGCGASTRIEMALGRSPDDVWQAVLNTVHQWREVRTIVSTPEETVDPQISVLLRARASLIKHSAAPEKREAIPRIAAVRPIKAFKFTCERELNRDVHASGDQSVATVIGWRSAATATGFEGKVRGKEECALFLVERNEQMEIVSIWSSIVGGGDINADIYYTLKSGQPVETD